MQSQLRDDDGCDVKQSNPCLLFCNTSNATSIATEQLTERGVNRDEEAVLPFASDNRPVLSELFFFLACFWKGRTTGVERQIKNKLRCFYRFDSRFLVLSMLAKKNGMLWHSVELSHRSSYWFQLRFLRRTFKIPRACSKVHIVVWRVVNKVILQNSFGSSETSSRHLAELKANIDVVLGKWGSLHHFSSLPLLWGIFVSHNLVEVRTHFLVF